MPVKVDMTRRGYLWLFPLAVLAVVNAILNKSYFQYITFKDEPQAPTIYPTHSHSTHACVQRNTQKKQITS